MYLSSTCSVSRRRHSSDMWLSRCSSVGPSTACPIPRNSPFAISSLKPDTSLVSSIESDSPLRCAMLFDRKVRPTTSAARPPSETASSAGDANIRPFRCASRDHSPLPIASRSSCFMDAPSFATLRCRPPLSSSSRTISSKLSPTAPGASFARLVAFSPSSPPPMALALPPAPPAPASSADGARSLRFQPQFPSST